MKTTEQLKNLVREKYSEIANQDKAVNRSSCCGAGGCSAEVYNIMTDGYDHLPGYNPEADLGLGCGLPTEFAQIKAGDTVVDLGSGAGNDAFVARAVTGPEGKVIGIDFSEAMLERARANADKLGFNNVEFRLGDIEQIPLPAERVDVVVSNCVLNLVPDKQKAFAEIFRILKPGSHFSVSDIVLEGALPGRLREAAEMYAGCVAGAMQKEAYLDVIRQAGFEDIAVQKQKAIVIPDDILKDYLGADEIQRFRENPNAIVSITVFGRKPAPCCGDSCCA